MEIYKVIPSPIKLNNYVDHFWYSEIELQANESYVHHSVASSKSNLIFRYAGEYLTTYQSGKEEKMFSAGIFGQATDYREFTATSKKAGLFGVRFYPHAIPLLFNFPANELSNGRIDITDLLGKQGIELVDKVSSSIDVLQKVSIVTDLLENRLIDQDKKHRNVAIAIHQIHQSKGQVLLTDLISNSHLSQRQFERNFKAIAGFGVKHFLRLTRFENAVEIIRSTKDFDSQNLAFKLGYADQSHFIREFKEFAGVTPKRYLKLL